MDWLESIFGRLSGEYNSPGGAVRVQVGPSFDSVRPVLYLIAGALLLLAVKK